MWFLIQPKRLKDLKFRKFEGKLRNWNQLTRSDGLNNLGRRFCVSLRLDCYYRKKETEFRNWIVVQTPLVVREKEEKMVKRGAGEWSVASVWVLAERVHRKGKQKKGSHTSSLSKWSLVHHSDWCTMGHDSGGQILLTPTLALPVLSSICVIFLAISPKVHLLLLPCHHLYV